MDSANGQCKAGDADDSAGSARTRTSDYLASTGLAAPRRMLPAAAIAMLPQRIPELKHRRLYSFGKPSDYPTLEPMIGKKAKPLLTF